MPTPRGTPICVPLTKSPYQPIVRVRWDEMIASRWENTRLWLRDLPKKPMPVDEVDFDTFTQLASDADPHGALRLKFVVAKPRRFDLVLCFPGCEPVAWKHSIDHLAPTTDV